MLYSIIFLQKDVVPIKIIIIYTTFFSLNEFYKGGILLPHGSETLIFLFIIHENLNNAKTYEMFTKNEN